MALCKSHKSWSIARAIRTCPADCRTVRRASRTVVVGLCGRPDYGTVVRSLLVREAKLLVLLHKKIRQGKKGRSSVGAHKMIDYLVCNTMDHTIPTSAEIDAAQL